MLSGLGRRENSGRGKTYERFARADDESLAGYFEKKEYIATSIDGLPGRPLPLPPTPARPY